MIGRDLGALRAGLEAWLGRPVDTIERPAAGYSCETLVVDREVVVRLPPLGAGTHPVYDLALEAAMQTAAEAAGVPIAAPVRFEPSDAWLGAPFIAMPFVDGPIPAEFTPSDPWLAGLDSDDARRAAWDAFVDTVVAIHRVDVAAVDGLRRGLDAELAWWETYADWATDGSPPPALVSALAWCRNNRPDAEPPSGALWGDVRLGNVVFDAATRRPRAVLDWDMASVGPLELDLGWFLALDAIQRELSGTSVPGFGTRDDLVVRVEAAIGRALVDLEWFETYALVRASAVATRLSVLAERDGRRSMFGAGEDPMIAAAGRRIGARQ